MRQYSRIIKACVTGMLLALLASSMDPVLVFAGTIPAGKAVVWNNPSSLFSSEMCLSVSSVAFSDTATVIKVLASDPGYNFRLMKNTYLLADDGGKYMIRRCEEYPLGKTMPLKGKKTILTFVFDPVPRRQKSIDLIEDVGTSGLQLIGIHDQRRPLKIKPCSCDGGRELEEMRAGFFKRDSVCIRGRFEKVPKDRTGMIHYRDNLTGKGIPAMVSINDDGSFERRIIADQPFIEYLKFGRKSVPFFAMPGGTTDILVHRDGTVDYTDGNGRPLICSNYLRSPLFEMKIYDYESEQKDIKSMTFREYGEKMDSLAEAGVKLVDYLAPRLSFTPLEYVLARESMLLRCTLPLFDFKMEWRLDPKGEETNDPANYAVLRRLPVDDPLAMTELDYYFFQNYYSFLSPIAGKGYVVRDGKGRNIEQSYAEKMRTCLSVDNEIFGRKDPSIMIKVHFLHKLQEEFDCCSDEEWNSDALAAAKEMLASDPAFVSKADMMYRSHLATKDIIRRLPEAEKATMALRKI